MGRNTAPAPRTSRPGWQNQAEFMRDQTSVIHSNDVGRAAHNPIKCILFSGLRRRHRRRRRHRSCLRHRRLVVVLSATRGHVRPAPPVTQANSFTESCVRALV